ncbi:DNA translocase FtsK [Pseudosulfitobacter pseudonitzschiae]|uniref:DNA translocase FtsK n=1 Tax=Pseudosulfitobacter pseudonitzschiae TaxID=1402135 RepID=UPI001AFC9CF1|nr:DNA translocase FtsK [Pseudosulfitobacter pseudonitzschiae]MBM1815849.1 DNA translocase FtsK 4TM domain-containing protein [Pseudosulfitobacter pseudonitzschiae]MBM1832840.1 DNA translocase FtsK 4TM domain-containing protein [Pseudosulfitobacter pseudonitzschiae]MBM1837708.1 DNA translocase FtsK 4TM domain-containing protein [Pseudosulfitobacter pseudonitzschiae]MBM1842554.1 DNA translocase FtsK 4TM domain-containing protein [Pseudosulfitobacter pseudonitzschiae]MBM1847422.1 DNA translocase
MAYQTRGRDPLLDTNMAEAIEKRGKELIGIALLVAGLMAAAMIGSYTPDDPNWMMSTDAPVQNWLGRTGASIAAPLFMIAGWGAWGIAAVLLVWGVRFALHAGDERAVGRLIFAPIVVAFGAIYAATLEPDVEWLRTHSFGLGGLFGDTVMGAILTILPLGSAFAVKTMSLLMGVGIVVLSAFVMGFTMPELKRIGRFLLIGLIMVYAWTMTLLGRGASGAVQGARTLQARTAERREQKRIEAEENAAFEAQQSFARPIAAKASAPTMFRTDAAPKSGLLARMPGLVKRPDAQLEQELPEPELIETYSTADVGEGPGDDRIKAKIADVIKSRVRQVPVLQAETTPKPLTHGLAASRRPAPLVLNTTRPAALPPEPPVTAPATAPAMRAEPPLTASRDYFSKPMTKPVAAPAVTPERAPAPEPMAYAQAEDFDDQMIEDPYAEAEDEHFEALALQQPEAKAPAIPVAEPRKIVQQPLRKTVQPSKQARAESQPTLSFADSHPGFELPPLSLLESPETVQRLHLSDEALEENARMLESVLDDYGVKGEIVSVRPGPVVTMYELEPAPGLKASRVIGLADDIARSMAALSARVSTVPGRSVIGIELPNEHREKVVLREILASRDFGDSNMRLPLALGKDIGGDSVVANLAKMPHLLIAGTTGSGKSVAINTMILSLLYKLTPEECRLIMIDPKMLELSVYDGIPHLLSPVVTDPKKAVVALKWTVGEMEERYRKMSKMGVRNIEGYNGRVREALAKGEMFSRTVQTGFDDDTGEPMFETEEFQPVALPYIVVVVDEMADLMMVAGKEIEACIQRLAQMARASGIHLIMATQRPSVDVITGTIKANFPTRISFQVTSKIDSRTILGEMGAEQLLGMGDMLYMAGGAKITRCHGPFVSDEEVEEIVNHLKAYGAPDYVSGVVEGPDEDKESNIDAVLGLGGNTDGEDALYDTAVAIVVKDRKCSTSYIQRKLAIGYNKAARLVEQMEDQGVVSAANHVGKREILVPEQ